MKCKCDFRTFMVGDGCDVCNPAKALEYARETIDEQAALIEEMGKALSRLLNSDKEGAIATASDDVLMEATYDTQAGKVVREQAAAVLQARAVLAKWKESK